jgi:hypothetical protein
MRGDEVREILAVGNHPDRHDVGLTTRRPEKGSTDLELETEGASLACYRFTHASKLEKGVPKAFPPLEREAQRNEENRLEPPDGMGRGQQVVTNLRVLDDNKVNIRKTHDAPSHRTHKAISCDYSFMYASDAFRRIRAGVRVQRLRGRGARRVWCVGRLQTDADRARVLEGLCSATDGGGGGNGDGTSLAELSDITKRLAPRWFLMRDVHSQTGTVLMQPRWAMTFMMEITRGRGG